MQVVPQVSSLGSAQANRQVVLEFYDLAFSQRQPWRAAQQCIAATPAALAGRPGNPQAYVAAVSGWLDNLPRLRVRLHRCVAEGDLVVAQGLFLPEPGARPMLVLDLFRLAGGKIVEHWDAIQEADPLPGP